MIDPPRAYDIFISHHRADKAWVRRLARFLGNQEYNGRKLRPWLDEHFLDPGILSSNLELTTALDRSRILGLVLSPEAIASKWVDFELRYYLESRGADHVVVLLREDCALPDALNVLPLLDFRADQLAEDSVRPLLARLCPPTELRLDNVKDAVDAAFAQLEAIDPGGFGPGTRPERDAFFADLSRHDIDEGGSEGLAIAAFARAGENLRRARADGSKAAYNCKMLLGECLAAALCRNPSYRQIARRFLDITTIRAGDPTLLFVVARAYSKLAEIDVRLVDTSVLLRAASQLDTMEPSNEVEAVVSLLARVAGKLRDKPAGELLIKALTGGGRASRIVAAGGISLSYHLSGPVFYLSELERLHQARGEERVLPVGPPSRRLLGELFALDLAQDASVQRAVRVARDEVQQAYPGTDLPYGISWFLRHEAIDAEAGHNTPFTGTIVKATLKNMIELADQVDVSTVACLTEPRIVDALFDGCGALLIPKQDADSPQCGRLRTREVPFAMVTPEVMAQLNDGNHVIVDEGQIRVLRQ